MTWLRALAGSTAKRILPETASYGAGVAEWRAVLDVDARRDVDADHLRASGR